MRRKLTITVDNDLILKINKTMLNNRIFRSKSHVIEEALRNYLEDEK